MVNIEIPTNYTNSPSSYNGASSLTINRDITSLDLDSSNAFEGPEKLLEVWFTASERVLPAGASPLGLKAVSQDVWKEMLDLVNCKVLSVIESHHVDAYLLSESSMFVFPHKLVLKTCGTTTLLCGLPRMLEIAALEAGFPHVKTQALSAAATPYRIFYSRKNFLFPDQQRGPHRSWRDEVRYLDKMFVGGSAYMIGKMNGDHWYLYITGPGTMLTPPATPEDKRAETITKQIEMKNGGLVDSVTSVSSTETGDETLEILMTDLEEKNARQFYLDHASEVAQDNARSVHKARKDAIEHLGVISERNGSDPSIYSGNTLVNIDDSRFDIFEQTSTDHSGTNSDVEEEALAFSEELTTEGHTLGSVVSETCGLADVYPQSQYPDARIDSYLFTPCGYSANGVVPLPGAESSANYWTVHVTPEPHCSYASFETNVPTKHTGRETVDVVQQVVGIFKPGRFSVTLFEAKGESDIHAAKKDKRLDFVEGYRRVDRIVHDLDGYELVFRYFERIDWKGGAPPRLGEKCL